MCLAIPMRVIQIERSITWVGNVYQKNWEMIPTKNFLISRFGLDTVWLRDSDVLLFLISSENPIDYEAIRRTIK